MRIPTWATALGAVLVAGSMQPHSALCESAPELPPDLREAIAGADSIRIAVAIQEDTFPWAFLGGFGYDDSMSTVAREEFVGLLTREGAFAPLRNCQVCGDRCDRHQYTIECFRAGHEMCSLFVCAEERVLVAVDSKTRFAASYAPIGHGINALLEAALPRDSTVATAAVQEILPARPRLDDWFVGERTPRPIDFASVRFPKSYDEAGDSLRAYVWVLVDTAGRAREVRSTAWSVGKKLLSAARAAILTWHFEPALCGGRPVATWTALPVLFTRTP